MFQKTDLLSLYQAVFDTLSSGDLQRLMERCYQITGIPILVTDIMYNLYGAAPQQTCGDYYWNYLLENHCYTDEMIVKLYEEGIMQTADELDPPYIVDFGTAVEGYPKLLGLVKVNGVTEGYVVMQCSRGQLTDALKEAMLLISRACGLIFGNVLVSHALDMTHRNVLADALFNNRIQTQKQLDLWFLDLGFCPIAPFRVLTLQLTENREQIPLSYLRNALQQYYPDQLSIIQDHTLYLLLYNLGKTSETHFSAGQFLSLLKNYKAHCGISNLFYSLLDLPDYRRQALDALRYGALNNPGGCIYYYSDYYLPAILTPCFLQLPACSWISPVITAVREYDLEHDTDYLETLQVFINSLCSTSLAAEELHMHRNSLMYRLRKIEEIADCTLKDKDTFLHLIISFYLLDLNHQR